MKTAKDYKVKYPYGLTTGYWSKSRPHRGNDRPTPCGTPLVIGKTQVGLTGVSGEATGCHLHTQAGTDVACQKTFKPNSLEFKGGEVVNLRKTDQKAWGRFVTIKVGYMKYITYAHLKRVDVKMGQVISSFAKPKPKAKPKLTWKTVKVPLVYVRDKPTTKSKLSGSRFLLRGMRFRTTGLVKGQSVKGNNKWYKSKAGNYIWAGGVR